MPSHNDMDFKINVSKFRFLFVFTNITYTDGREMEYIGKHCMCNAYVK